MVRRLRDTLRLKTLIARIRANEVRVVAYLALFVALGGTTLPAHDVHGRSTIVQLSWNEVERRFGRQ